MLDFSYITTSLCSGFNIGAASAIVSLINELVHPFFQVGQVTCDHMTARTLLLMLVYYLGRIEILMLHMLD